MSALEFATSQLKWTSLASALGDISDTAWTMACLHKISAFGSWRGISYLHSGGSSRAGLGYGESVSAPVTDVLSGVQFNYTWNTLQSVPHFMCVSKPEGSPAQLRLSVKLGAAGSVTHHTSGTLNDVGTSDELQIGTWQATDYWAGHIGLVAYWAGAMSDADKEALTTNWRTSDLWNSAHGEPVFLAELNVAAASVVDLAGNASSLTVSGSPTLDSGEDMDSWDFDGTGVIEPATAVLIQAPQFF